MRYDVLRARTLGGGEIHLTAKPLDEPRFVDSTAVPGTPLFYRVLAIDSEGCELGFSPVLPVRPGGLDVTPPDHPAITSFARKVRSPA